ncbi:MAG: aminotransferase class V-fold PLP-dependent enzyme [Sinobacteraceae bacterium]|nr:aminotransferase class V-fold PLP-dependent enzyme [Nevskiaceae bacterium]MCP5472819.1 aminotransferase class V-fold PLP-dependent enzyme [Nevskiaceae bacterium]
MSGAAPIYLDYAATTPVDPRVAAVMAGYLTSQGVFGNAASASHAYGREAAACLEAARAEVAALIGAPPEAIVFTSGATEADNLAVLGIARGLADRGRHLVTLRTEHKAVLDPCRRLEKEGYSVTWLEPGRDGRLDPEVLRKALRADTVLVSIMHANNEIGVVQDLAAMAAICRSHDVLLHSDAAQAAARIRLEVDALGVDLLSLSAHKLYGPKGIGALYVSPAARPWLLPLGWGGGHERGLRPGTPATHQAAGFAAAARVLRAARAEEEPRLAALGRRLEAALADTPGVVFNGHREHRLPGLVSVSFRDVEGESLVAGLPGLALSSGAACDSASGEPSYVLRALGHPPELAQSTLRLSLGRFTTAAEVDQAAQAIDREVRRLAVVAPEAPAADHIAPASTPLSAAVVGGPHQDVAAVDAAAVGSAAAATAWRAPQAPPLLTERVWQLFRDLPGAGAPAPGSGAWIRGRAGSRREGAEVVFHLQCATDGTVSGVRYQVFGCPHTLATTAWVAARLQGRHLARLVPGTPLEWAEVLEVPATKLGRLLRIEDALHAVVAACRQSGGLHDARATT